MSPDCWATDTHFLVSGVTLAKKLPKKWIAEILIMPGLPNLFRHTFRLHEICFIMGGMGSLKKQIIELCNGIFVKSLPFKLNDLDLRIRFGPSQP